MSRSSGWNCCGMIAAFEAEPSINCCTKPMNSSQFLQPRRRSSERMGSDFSFSACQLFSIWFGDVRVSAFQLFAPQRRRCQRPVFVIYNSIMKVTDNTLTVSRAQAGLPRLCNSGKSFLITNRDKPTAVLLPIADYECLIETMDLLSNPQAMKTLRAAKAGKLSYKNLDLDDENFGV
jgi:PHD/YefM family antitoxin component YafN of YafNO toxin-antitoxin module